MNATAKAQEFRAKWNCPIHTEDGRPLEICGFCYDHDTFVCRECSFNHMMCDHNVLLINVQKKVVLNGNELKGEIVKVKKQYEERLQTVTMLKEAVKKEMNEKMEFFNTLVEEIKKAMKDHCESVEKELDEAVDRVSHFPSLCEQNLSTLGILEGSGVIYKMDPDTFKRFCTSFDKELSVMTNPIGVLERETVQIKSNAAEFSKYVSEAAIPIKMMRDRIVFSSKVKNKPFVEKIVRRKFMDKGKTINKDQCFRMFEEAIGELSLHQTPSKEKIKEAFETYDFLDPNEIADGIASEAIMEGLEALDKNLKVTNSSFVASRGFVPA